jgi:serine/threonine protein kinase/Tol biopolymer transport system component
MSVEVGTRLGSLEITALLGKGGMGEVYRARDTKLKRDVAIKILPEEFSRNADRVSRFLGEAEVLASLNHPNIGAIYDLEELNGTRFLVLELVEGETLADRIARGSIPVDETLHIAKQIAEALEAAHELGVVHRDLKPANVKITPDGKVKVLDFGLAKAFETEAAGMNLSNSPTLVSGSVPGVILGTAAYMSPEQARGKTVDRRADIWAFGVLLFEMLTGRRLFEGETVADTLAKVLEREPDLEQLRRRTPLALRKLIQRCLTKNVKDRLQAIGDARTSLHELIANPAASADEVAVSEYPAWKKFLPWVVAPLFLAIGWMLKPAAFPQNSVSRFEYTLPDGQVLAHAYRHGAEISPDGQRIAFTAGTFADEPQPTTPPPASRRIYVKSIDRWDATPLQGTEGGVNPAFSADGQWLAFYTQGPQLVGQIKKVAVTGGPPAVLTENPASGSFAAGGLFGITWSRNGAIVFATGTGGLKMIPEAGGERKDFTELDPAAHEVSHRLPHFLPDGSGVLFTVLRYTFVAPDWKRAQVWIKSLRTGERKLLLENAVDARYANGYLVFSRQAKLYAVRFDLNNLSVIGSPVPVLDEVTNSTVGNAVATTGAAQFSLSDNGTLLYAPGSISPPVLTSLVWVDRNGRITPLAAKPMSRISARISSDGKRVAFAEYYVDKHIWVLDLGRGTQERQTSDGQNVGPIWTPDGSGIAFRSDWSGPGRLFLKRLDSSDVVPLTTDTKDSSSEWNDSPSSWTPDGKQLAFVRTGETSDTGGTNTLDIYVMSLDETNKPRPLLNSKYMEAYPEFSPDGHWLAYCSDESGRSELYVQPYPGPGHRVLVSTDGAREPAWSKDGKELFYRSSPDGKQMMSVRFRISGAEFIPEQTVKLFEGQFMSTVPVRSWDIAPDGRFLMLQPVPGRVEELKKSVYSSTLRIVLNWSEELKHALAAAR